MKRFSNILVTLGVTLFLMSLGMRSEVEAQPPCDSTWTQKKDTLTISGCKYEIDLCIQCTYAHPGKVKVNGVKKLDDSCTNSPLITYDQLSAQVISQTSNWAYVYFETCILSGPPCDMNDSEIVTYRYPRCWFMVKDTNENQTMYIPCNDQYCDVEYEYCVELPSMNVRLTEIGHTEIGGHILDCTLEGYEVPLPTIHMVPTKCFILHTPCD